MSIQASERQTYDDIAGLEAYARYSPGELYAPVFLALIRAKDWPIPPTVLDAGCCTGKGGAALAAGGCEVTLCDLTFNGVDPSARELPFVHACLWHDLTPIAKGKGHPNRTRFDYVFCCDVLEHIPTQFSMLVVSRLLEIARHGLFLSISLVPDAFGVWAGRPLHQTVQPYLWWKASIAELGDVLDARDLLGNALFFVKPRR